ncbi:GntR family transcriptional regulator [Streptomyces sp. URMC 124]|uniref:GntR family transcriptional regulator n=1 Tax=Streptomyces sp. URMC 124 TaxID=3423405 RepID=UPI003F1D2634
MTEALHRRIAADLVRRIQSGEWPSGAQLPSRVTLASEYSVHEQTIRLAVTLLRRRGILEGEQRQRLYVAHPPPMRALTDPDAEWPHAFEVLDRSSQAATVDLAGRLSVAVGASLRREIVECMDPGGRSAMVVTTWRRGRRVGHATAVVEVGVAEVDVRQAAALGLPVDTLAYRLVRTRLDGQGCPVETADLILPMDRWVIRLTPGHA